MKLKILVLISMILFISAACDQGSFFGGGSGSSRNDAILFEFIPNMPAQDEIYEGQNFRVGINVINFEEEQKKTHICVYDSLGDWSGGIPPGICDTIVIDSAYKYQDEVKGTEERIYFPDKEGFYNYRNIEGKVSTNIFAELYYEHETIALSQMCIKREIDVNPVGIKCELSSQEDVENNNAPVKITSIEKNVIPAGRNKVNLRLEINIDNVGSGEVIDKNDLFINREKDSIIDVDVVLNRQRPITFECTGLLDNKRLAFRENQKTIICENTIDMKDEFSMEQVKITLNYGYKLEKLTSTINIIDKDKF